METSELNVTDADVSTLIDVNNSTQDEDVVEVTVETEVETNSTNLIEYKEVDNPCVALTIIGENKLTDAEVFVRRGIRFSIKAFFSTLLLTIMKMFI